MVPTAFGPIFLAREPVSCISAKTTKWSRAKVFAQANPILLAAPVTIVTGLFSGILEHSFSDLILL
jgi:hypothetical protein